MIIRILLVVIILVLAFVASYLNKNNLAFSKVLAEGTEQEPIRLAFQRFAKTCLVLAIVGVLFFFLGNRLLALIYIGSVMLASAIFSIKLSKLIS